MVVSYTSDKEAIIDFIKIVNILYFVSLIQLVLQSYSNLISTSDRLMFTVSGISMSEQVVFTVTESIVLSENKHWKRLKQ